MLIDFLAEECSLQVIFIVCSLLADVVILTPRDVSFSSLGVRITTSASRLHTMSLMKQTTATYGIRDCRAKQLTSKHMDNWNKMILVECQPYFVCKISVRKCIYHENTKTTTGYIEDRWGWEGGASLSLTPNTSLWDKLQCAWSFYY